MCVSAPNSGSTRGATNRSTRGATNRSTRGATNPLKRGETDRSTPGATDRLGIDPEVMNNIGGTVDNDNYKGL